MAYHHPDLYNAGNNAPNYIADYPPTQQSHLNTSPYSNNYDQNSRSDWDGRSTKSYQSSYAGSQAHLVPYEMSQVSHHAPPVPSLPGQYPDYPPVQQQRPGMYPVPNSPGYSMTREKMMKRRSVRQIELFQGNLVLDVPAATSVVPAGQSHEEFTTMRYTAATCDPDDFMKKKYSLRPYLYGRHTELFIVMTMYNEDEVLFCKTMNACVAMLPVV